MERHTSETRVCPHCHSKFTPNSGKQVYCANSCRVNAHKAKNKQHNEELVDLVNDQAERLQKLASEPKIRKEVIKEVNPDWSQIKRKVDAQQKICSITTDQLMRLHKEIEELIEPRVGKIMGIMLGITIAAIFISIGYGDRTRRPLNLTFIVLSIALLFLLGVMGYYAGKIASKQFASEDAQRMNKLGQKHKQYGLLESKLLSENEVLASLETALLETPNFIKDTVVYVDETVVNPS